MQIPVAMHRNLETGDDTLIYAEFTDDQLGDIFAALYNKQHPDAPLVKKTKESV